MCKGSTLSSVYNYYCFIMLHIYQYLIWLHDRLRFFFVLSFHIYVHYVVQPCCTDEVDVQCSPPPYAKTGKQNKNIWILKKKIIAMHGQYLYHSRALTQMSRELKPEKRTSWSISSGIAGTPIRKSRIYIAFTKSRDDRDLDKLFFVLWQQHVGIGADQADFNVELATNKTCLH